MADRKKLFFIINRLVLGGHSADAVSLAQQLSLHYAVTIVYGEKETSEKEVPLQPQQYPSITFIKLSSLHRSILPWQDFSAYRQLLSLFRHYRPDIVHTHGFKAGLLGRLAARKTSVPVIIHTYHGHVFHSYYNRFVSSVIVRIERYLASLSTRIIAISPRQSDELSTTYRIAPAKKISTIFLGIDKAMYLSQNNSDVNLRNEYRIPKDTVVIAIVGRLVRIKYHSFFIAIARQLLQQEQNVCFVVVGDGDQKPLLQQKLTRQKLTWQEGKSGNKHAPIVFTSWITNIGSILPDIDIVMLTSLNEGTPVSLIEAQLFCKPVVTTNVGGVRDTIMDGETGFLIDNFSADDFVKKLQQLVHDKNLRDRMGRTGEVFATERFSKEKEVAAINKLYNDCLQETNNK